jgi:tetraacyldisaccharide 4'-kinase
MPSPERLRGRVREWVPRWWRGEGGPVGQGMDLLFWPAEALFRAAVAIRNGGYDAGALRVERAPIPVVSIGNLGVGGAGKTPFSAWVAGRVAGWGHRPALVLRGYGADEVQVHRELNPAVPVFATPRRIEGVREAAEAACDVAVLDDAFQHRRLGRDLDLVLIAADGWRAPLRLLPRGGWREGLGALRRADLVVVTRKAAAVSAARQVEGVVAGVVGSQRVVRSRLAPGGILPIRGGVPAAEPIALEALAGREVLAVTSLADPRPFAAQLSAAGASVELAAFPDHHDFTHDEAQALAVRGRGRPLLLTRKEAVKLRALLPEDAEAWMLDQRVVIESNEEILDEALRRAVRR